MLRFGLAGGGFANFRPRLARVRAVRTCGYSSMPNVLIAEYHVAMAPLPPLTVVDNGSDLLRHRRVLADGNYIEESILCTYVHIPILDNLLSQY